MKVKPNDFIELEFTGYVDGKVFDTTNKDIAKENGIEDWDKVKPIKIVVGKNEVVKGLDEALIDKEVGKEYEIILKPEDAFGVRDPNLIKVFPINEFIKHEITPFPGLQVEIDGLIGTIKSVNSGRVRVDFNHPLADKEVHYKFKILKIIEDKKEKVKLLLEKLFVKPDIEVKEEKIVVKLPRRFEKLDDVVRKLFEDTLDFDVVLEYVEENEGTQGNENKK